MPRKVHVPGQAQNDLPETHVCFILDESGSMSTRLVQVLSGFKEYLDTIKAEAGHVHFGLTLFNTACRVAYAGVPVAEVVALTKATYRPGGNTSLYDAIAEAVEAQEHRLAEVREPWRVLCVVMTDGEENSSQRWTKARIAELIQGREATGRWSFAYLGADQQAWQEAAAIGMPVGSTATYNVRHTETAFRAMGMATVAYASNPAMATANFYEGVKALTADAETESADEVRVWTKQLPKARRAR